MKKVVEESRTYPLHNLSVQAHVFSLVNEGGTTEINPFRPLGMNKGFFIHSMFFMDEQDFFHSFKDLFTVTTI